MQKRIAFHSKTVYMLMAGAFLLLGLQGCWEKQYVRCEVNNKVGIIIALKIINDLPEDASYDEVISEIQFRKMVELGIQDSKDNKVISTADLQREITKW